ncbi:hypothetical protein [Gloeothece verrucosa]|uniref:Lipoprotein n=1 Tax=Gloeothece verrucosa (strain PCC 7822) TaxID=497965 RepID=E0UMB4_GLOV7|nr:hypothetical protein [Gloeothece verrucosa]ADN18094.1 hypothetical protein Cyan7822_6294 [Gloeothece verrucosa PCC 7822]
MKKLLICLFLLTGCSSSLTLRELNEKSVAQIAQENTNLSADALSNLKITYLWNDNREALHWVDFNNEQLCGIKYCLYALYAINEGQLQLLWRAYLDPLLPPKVNLIEPDKPCLKINQFNKKNPDVLDQYSLCPDLGKYQITDKQAIPLNRSQS